MPTSDAQVAALRALLMQDADETMRLTALLGDAGTTGYWRLAEAVLSVLAERRFSPRFTTADLVRYVAGVRRARVLDGAEYDIDPIAAENVLRFALGQIDADVPDPESRMRAVLALLNALAESELTEPADVDQLLEEARALADRWSAAQANP
jgi:hypothetical protein